MNLGFLLVPILVSIFVFFGLGFNILGKFNKNDVQIFHQSTEFASFRHTEEIDRYINTEETDNKVFYKD